MNKSVVVFFIVSLILLAGAMGTLYWYIMNQASDGERVIDLRTNEQKLEDQRVGIQSALEEADKQMDQQKVEEQAQNIQNVLEELDKQKTSTSSANTSSNQTSTSQATQTPQYFFDEPDPDTQKKIDEISKALKSAN